MTDIATLGIAVDSRQVRQGGQDLDRLAARGDAAERKITTATGQMQSGFQRLRAQIFSVHGLMATFGVGFSLRAIINAVSEQEHVTAQLEARLRSTGGVAGQTMQQMQALGAQMQRTTKFSNEQVESAQALLLTFTRVQGDVFPATIRAAADMATAMGQDLNSSIQQVGRALNDPIQGLQALTRSGVQFTDAQKDMIKALVDTGRTAEAQAVILAELETQFGGSAEAARNTLGGALAALKNEFDDLLKRVGQSAPLTQGIQFLVQNFQTLAVAGGALVTLFGVRLVASLGAAVVAKIAATQQAIAYQAALARMAGQSYAAATAAGVLRGAMAFLGGPAGVAMLAAGAIAWFATRSKEARADTQDFSRTIKELRGDMEALRAEAVQAEMDKVKLAMVSTQAEIAKISETWKRSDADMRALIEPHVQRLKELGQSYAEFQEILDGIGATPPVTPPGVEAPAGGGGSDDTEKHIRALELQAASFQMSAHGAELYKMALAGASDEQLAAATSLYEHIAAMEAANDARAEEERAIERKAALLARENEMLQQGVLQIELALLDEEERMREAYERREFMLEDAFQRGLISHEYHQQLLEKMEADHQDRLNSIKYNGMSTANKFAVAFRDKDIKNALAAGAQMTAGVAQQNRAMFETNKALALANAAVALPDAVLQSFRNGGGYPMGLVPAGLMLATGLAQMNAIRSASFGGGASAPSVAGSTPAPPTTNVPAVNPTQEPERSGSSITIQFTGDVFGWDDYIQEKVIGGIKEAVRDHDEVIIERGSRNASELAA